MDKITPLFRAKMLRYHIGMEAIIREYLVRMEPKLCVIATVDENGSPESAVMAYAIAEGLTIILSTHTDTRKWRNLKRSPRISLVFGWDMTGYNVQYEGEATLVLDDEETEKIYYTANPFLVQYKDMPGSAYIKVRPKWIRITDYSINPPKITENQF